MSDLLFGQIITGQQVRDAVHVACAPVIASKRLHPGDHIGLVEGSQAEVTDVGVTTIGIVDPYLRTHVNQGQQFWLFLYPQTVTGLRHKWSHPSFLDDEPLAKSTKRKRAAKKLIVEKPLAPVPISVKPDASYVPSAKERIERYANSWDLDYQEVLEAAEDYLKHGSYLCDGSRWEGEYVDPEFWVYYEIVTGTKVDKDKRGSFFSCSC